MDLSNFQSRFYNLEGTSIGEKRKKLYKLLQTEKYSSANVQPRNFLEEIFKVETLLYFHRTNEISEIFRTNNEVFIKLILKHDWCLLEEFGNHHPYELVNGLLPKFSHAIRAKILNKISKIFSEEKFDVIFDYILARYGQNMAVRYLPSCSQSKIETFLRNTEVTLTPKQLKIIFDKSPELLMVYVDQQKSDYNLSDGCLFAHIAQKNPKFCLKLYSNPQNRGLPRLGRQTTKIFVKANQEAITDNIQNFSSILNTPMMVRKTRNFKNLLYKFFPSKPQDLDSWHFKDIIITLLKCFPKERRWNIFRKAFIDKFNVHVEDNLDFLTEEYLEILPEDKKYILNTWADNKYQKTNDNQYLQYMEPLKAFNILKEKIQFTSKMFDRYALLKLMINNATNNKNLHYLEKVLEYISKRHRNEDAIVRKNILYEIQNNVNFENINEKHWKPILELLDVEKVKERQISKRSFNLYKKYIEFLYKNNLISQKVLEEFARDCIKIEAPIKLCTSDPKTEYDLLCDLFNIIPNIKDIEVSTNFLTQCLENIMYFNKLHKNLKILAPQFKTVNSAVKDIFNCSDLHQKGDKIAFFATILKYNYNNPTEPFQIPENEKLLQILNIILASEQEVKSNELVNLHEVFRKLEETLQIILFKTTRSNFENQLLDMYFSQKVLEKNKYGFTNNLTKWIQYFLTNDPQVIANNFDSILSVIDPKSFNHKCISMIKSYSHLNLDERLISYYRAIFLSDPKSLHKSRFLQVLPLLMHAEEYLKFVEKYIPEDTKLYLDNLEQRDLFAVQCDVVKSLKNVSDLELAMPFIMKFTQGDYLQSSLPTLYKALAKIPELNIEIYLDSLMALEAVSAKKHVLFLACELLPVSNVKQVYIKMASCENSSIKKHWFRSLINYFSKNPTENLLNLAVQNLKKINKNDIELIDFVTGQVKIPSKYKGLYSEKLWEYLDQLQTEDSNLWSYYNSILNSIYIENMKTLSEHFCEKLVKTYFLTNPHLKLKMNRFVINYLLTYPQEKQINLVFQKLQDYKKNYFNWSDPHKAAGLSNFFIAVYAELQKFDLEFVTMFKKYWEELFTEIEDFQHLLMIKWMYFYKEDKNIEIFARKMNNTIKQLESKYAFYLFELIEESILSFVNSISKQEHFTDLLLKHQLLLNMPSRTNYLLTVYTLERQKQISASSPLYDEMLEMLIKVDDQILQIRLNNMISKH